MVKIVFVIFLLQCVFVVFCKYNVLFIVSDDFRPDIGGVYGQNEVSTPNLQKLIASSFTFKYAYTQFPLCNPTRTSFLTSLRPDTTRIWEIGPYFRDTMLNKTGLNVITLPQYFKNNGYFTIGAGKIFHGGSSSGGIGSEGGQDLPYSWSTNTYWYCNDYSNGSFLSPAMQQWPNGTGCVQNKECISCLKSYNSYGSHINPAFVVSNCNDTCYVDGATANYSEYIISQQLTAINKPWFFAVGFRRPHQNWFAPREWFDLYPINNVSISNHTLPTINMPPVAFAYNNTDMFKRDEFKNGNNTIYDYVSNRNVSNITSGIYRLVMNDYHATLRAAYYATVSFMDKQLGVVLNTLIKNDFWNNTIITFIGDHGYHLGELGEWNKRTLFELSTRVPMIIRIPNNVNMGKISNNIVEMLDLYPTLIDAVGLPSNNQLQGKSLMNIINGNNNTNSIGSNDGIAYSQTMNNFTDINNTEYKNVMGVSMRNNDWRYTEYVNYDFVNAEPIWNETYGIELYDHRNESNENNFDSYDYINIAYDQQYQHIVQQLHQQLLQSWPH